MVKKNAGDLPAIVSQRSVRIPAARECPPDGGGVVGVTSVPGEQQRLSEARQRESNGNPSSCGFMLDA